MGIPICSKCALEKFYQYYPAFLTRNHFRVWPTNCCICGTDHMNSNEQNYNIPELTGENETGEQAIKRFYETLFYRHNHNHLFIKTKQRG